MQTFPDQLQIRRSFWLCCREDLWGLQRIKVLWQYLRDVAAQEEPLLLGQSSPAFGDEVSVCKFAQQSSHKG